MERNNGQTIFLSVIGIATLLVAIIGATFAYFSTTVTGNTNAATGTVTTAQVANVTLSGTALTLPTSNVLPGADLGTMTVRAVASTQPSANISYPYTCTVSNTGAATAVSFQAKMDEGSYGSWNKLYDNEYAATSNNTVVKGTLTNADYDNTWTIAVRYDETGTDRTTAESGKNITVSVNCALDGNLYYTNGAANGTTQDQITPSYND